MLSYLIEFEGYRARVERARDGMLWGRVLELNEPINFKAQTVRVVETRFAQALQAYFERCRARGIEPEKPSGSGF